MDKREQFYKKLKKKLKKDTSFPTKYLFKFIVPADNKKIAAVESLFDSSTAQINIRTSKKGNFVSISAKEMMLSVDGVIERYEKAAKIEGIISL